MISRSAEECFWLCRHLERINHVARFMDVNYSYILDTNIDNYDQWFPFIIVLGEEKKFLKLYGEDDTVNSKLIQNYITWEEKNPVSIYEMSKAARENARVIRDIISNDLWEAINSFWLWLISSKSRRLYLKDKMAFYQCIKNNINTMYGQLYDSMLEGEEYLFMMLGMMLERASQTARIVDVKSHRIILCEASERETAIETLYWLNLLKFFSANEAFLKQSNCMNRQHVADFLIFEKSFPHTITYCLEKASSISIQLQKLTNKELKGNPISGLLKRIEQSNVNSILTNGLNDFLTDIVNHVSDICKAIESTYFDPEATYIKDLEELSK